jgi:hypothetical protein
MIIINDELSKLINDEKIICFKIKIHIYNFLPFKLPFKFLQLLHNFIFEFKVDGILHPTLGSLGQF